MHKHTCRYNVTAIMTVYMNMYQSMQLPVVRRPSRVSGLRSMLFL